MPKKLENKVRADDLGQKIRITNRCKDSDGNHHEVGEIAHVYSGHLYGCNPNGVPVVFNKEYPVVGIRQESLSYTGK